MKRNKKLTYRFTLLLAAIVSAGCAGAGGGGLNLAPFQSTNLTGPAQQRTFPQNQGFNNPGFNGQVPNNPGMNPVRPINPNGPRLTEDAPDSGGFGLTGGDPVPYNAISSNPVMEPVNGAKLYGHY